MATRMSDEAAYHEISEMEKQIMLASNSNLDPSMGLEDAIRHAGPRIPHHLKGVLKTHYGMEVPHSASKVENLAAGERLSGGLRSAVHVEHHSKARNPFRFIPPLSTAVRTRNSKHVAGHTRNASLLIETRGHQHRFRQHPTALIAHVRRQSHTGAGEAADSQHSRSVQRQDSDLGVPEVSAQLRKVFGVINKLIIEDQNKLVLKVFDCKSKASAASNQYRKNRMRAYDESYKLQLAVSQEKLGQIEQFEASQRMSNLVPTRASTKSTCDREILELQHEFQRISTDFDLARKIADGTSCAVKPGTSFLESCVNKSESRAEGFVRFLAGSEQGHLASLLQTSTARHVMYRHLTAVGGHGMELPGSMIMSENHRRAVRESVSAWDRETDELDRRGAQYSDYFFQDFSHWGQSGIVEGSHRYSVEEQRAHREALQMIRAFASPHKIVALDFSDAHAPSNMWIKPQLGKGRIVLAAGLGDNHTVGELGHSDEKFACTVSNNPNCRRLRDKLEEIVGELLSEKQHTEFLLSETRSRCTAAVAELDEQIAQMTVKQNEGARVEAEASAVRSEAQGNVVTLEREGRAILSTMRGDKDECAKEVAELRNTICGTKKLKQEVALVESRKTDQQPLSIHDCEVSDWVPGECLDSAVAVDLAKRNIFDVTELLSQGQAGSNFLHKCGPGGGTQYYIREVVSPARTPEYGAECPPLRLKTVCNDFECAVDCQLGDWEGWSACTKSCDGGMKRRLRTVNVYPQFGGDECDATKQEEACDMMACDRPCTLADWGPWRSCTRACESGITWRSRSISRPATGSGKCPKKFSTARYQKETCNEEPCPADVVCVAKMDLVVAVDASGSMDLTGWKAQVEGLLGFVDRLALSRQSRVLLGVLKFSWDVTVVHELTDDKQALVSAISDMKFDAYSSNIGGAFRAMQSMLQYGRRDAPSVCMMWTDARPSYPSSEYDAISAAHELRRSCRVLVLSMRPAVSLDVIRPWVSHPTEQNIIQVASPEAVSGFANQLNKLTCSQLQLEESESAN